MKDILSRYPRDFGDGLRLRPMEAKDEQALTDFLCVRMGHLAAEKPNRERRHRRDANCTQNAASRRLVMIRSPAAARDATQVPEAG